MIPMADESSTQPDIRSKVARLLEEDDLEGLGAEMEARWTAEEDRMSLRALAAYFNQEVLRRRLEAAGIDTLDGELENIYRLLTDEDVSAAERTRVRRRLQRDDLDVEAVEDDFVTYQAIRTYLKEYRDAEYIQEDRDPIEREVENVERLRGRVDTVTSGKLEQLGERGDLSLGSFRTVVDVKVVCEDCHSQYDVLDLLDRGGCDCA
jgi:hypothetical protein